MTWSTNLGTKEVQKTVAARMSFFARRYARLDMILSPEGTFYEHGSVQQR